jgi:hypothetical protein
LYQAPPVSLHSHEIQAAFSSAIASVTFKNAMQFSVNNRDRDALCDCSLPNARQTSQQVGQRPSCMTRYTLNQQEINK